MMGELLSDERFDEVQRWLRDINEPEVADLWLAEREARKKAEAEIERLTKIDADRHAMHVADINRRVKVEDALFTFVKETKKGKRGPFTIEEARSMALGLGVPEDVRVHYQGRAGCAEAALSKAREDALREAAEVARGLGHPVGASDGNTRTLGTSEDAARAILSLIPAAPAPDAPVDRAEGGE